MTQAITVRAIEPQALTVGDLKGRRDRMTEVLKKVMRNGVDYGKVPGCGDKPALLKPGAEKILATFELGVMPEQENIIDLGDSSTIRVRVIAPIVHIGSRVVVGHGIGECSSGEEKYAWKAAVCDQEWEETDPDNRRTKWKKGRNNTQYQVKQVRTNPADVANTVLKMAKKRAVVDGTLTATAASDIFEQGEDVTGDEDEGFNREGVEQAPKAKDPNEPCVPNYGKYAGQPFSDVPTDGLQDYADGVERSVGDERKKNFKAKNQQMLGLLKAEISKREAASKGVPPESEAPHSEDAAPSIDDSAWMDMCLMWSEGSPEELKKCCNEFQIAKESALKPPFRSDFSKRMRELVKGGK